MKIITILGARPQFIKAAPLSRQLRLMENLSEIIVHTGQHYDSFLSEVFFRELDIPEPDFNLGVGSGSHAFQTGTMMMRIEPVLEAENPDLALVYGDTNSTLAGALTAAKLHIPVAHVEAGMRSGNRTMPEEINRVLTDHISDFLFTSTETASLNLKKEGIPPDSIYQVGDLMLDAALSHARRAEAESSILQRLQIAPKNYLLATVHRAGNTDHPSRLKAILEGLRHVADRIPVVLPLHPRTKAALKKAAFGEALLAGIKIIEPVGYLDMIVLEKNASLIATDSGGIQKEAFFFKIPCVTLREETEWVELVDCGWNRLVPPHSPRKIADRILEWLGEPLPPPPENLYGDGKAAKKIVGILKGHCERRHDG